MKLTNFAISPNVLEFKDGWFTDFRTNQISILSDKNSNIICYKDNYIIKKAVNTNEYEHLIYSKCFEIPPFIKTIGSFVFYESVIKSIFIPSQVKEICDHAFEKCKQLENVEFGKDSNLQIIGSYAFAETNIKIIYIPSSVVEIRESAFDGCKQLKNFVLNEDSKLTIVGDYAFYNTSITSIYIQSLVYQIGPNSFYDNHKKSLIIEIDENIDLDIFKDFELSGFNRNTIFMTSADIIGFIDFIYAIYD